MSRDVDIIRPPFAAVPEITRHSLYCSRFSRSAGSRPSGYTTINVGPVELIVTAMSRSFCNRSISEEVSGWRDISTALNPFRLCIRLQRKPSKSLQPMAAGSSSSNAMATSAHSLRSNGVLA